MYQIRSQNQVPNSLLGPWGKCANWRCNNGNISQKKKKKFIGRFRLDKNLRLLQSSPCLSLYSVLFLHFYISNIVNMDLFSHIAGIPKCCITTKTFIPVRLLRKVQRYDVQKDSGACDIAALMWVMKLEMLHFLSKLAITMTLTSRHKVKLWFHIKYE